MEIEVQNVSPAVHIHGVRVGLELGLIISTPTTLFGDIC